MITILKGIKLNFRENTAEIKVKIKALLNEEDIMQVLNELSFKDAKKIEIYDYTFIKEDDKSITIYKSVFTSYTLVKLYNKKLDIVYVKNENIEYLLYTLFRLSLNFNYDITNIVNVLTITECTTQKLHNILNNKGL